MSKYIIFFICFFICTAYSYAQNKVNFDNAFLPNIIICKVKKEFKNKSKSSPISIEKIISNFNKTTIKSCKRMFPNTPPPKQAKDKQGRTLADLSLLYRVRIKPNTNINEAILILKKTKAFEYVETSPVFDLLYVPNDQRISSQYHLTNIKAYEAWDITKGDSNVVIGILDTGTDLDHPDLKNNLKYNYNDPIDGIDNDNDGYIDNYVGWNMHSNIWNTQYHKSDHGLKVAGIAAGATDDNYGIAGVGFKCKYLPIKVDTTYYSPEKGIDVSLITTGYEGIVYAAEHGCKIINCSWGKVGKSKGQYGQDIINYATINNDAIIIAACGNFNDSSIFYPASYDNVISVAGTNISDEKWVKRADCGSNYGYYVDIAAPGHNVYSSSASGWYADGGTSFASPIVAGAAGLLRSYYPNLNAIEIGEILRITTDNIDTITGNEKYENLLGKGRLNIYKALTDTSLISVRMIDYIFNDNSDSVINAGDTFYLYCDFNNILDSIGIINIKLQSLSPFITVLDSVLSFSNISKKSSFKNTSNPFVLKASSSIPSNHLSTFKITYSSGRYQDYQYFSETTNTNFFTVCTDKIKTTITSNGTVGYADEDRLLGKGFLYKGDISSILFHSGLMIGKKNAVVSENLYGSINNTRSKDFSTISPIIRNSKSEFSDIFANGTFTDSINNPYTFNAFITQNIYAWEDSENDNYIILEYLITNKSNSDLTNMFIGFFADWDIGYSTKNRASYDKNNKLAYIYPVDGGVHAGISILNHSNSNHFAIDNNGDNSSVTITDGFDETEKSLTLNPDYERNSAGLATEGNDVSHVVSVGPLSIFAHDTVVFTIAIIAADHQKDIIISHQKAKAKYDSITSVKNFISNAPILKPFYINAYPNPSSNYFNIHFYLPSNDDAIIKIYDTQGYEVNSINQNNYTKGWHNINISTMINVSGIYYLQFSGNKYIKTKKIIINK